MSDRARIQSPAEVRALQRDLDDHARRWPFPTPWLVLAIMWAAILTPVVWWLL